MEYIKWAHFREGVIEQLHRELAVKQNWATFEIPLIKLQFTHLLQTNAEFTFISHHPQQAAEFAEKVSDIWKPSVVLVDDR